MEMLIAIVLSIIILRIWWKSQTRQPNQHDLSRNTVKSRWARKRIKADKLKQEVAQARKAEIAKRKQQDTELITVILPTIDNDR